MVPLPPLLAMVAGAKLTVTPAGSVPGESATGAWKPPVALAPICTLAAPPTSRLMLDAAVLNVMLGAVATVRDSVAVRVTLPPLAVMVSGYVPGAMLALGVSASALAPDPGAGTLLGVNVAVRPAGSPLPVDEATESATIELNPPARPDIDTVAVPVRPWVTVSAFGLALSANPGAG
jgi:hypothetical protein